MDGEGNLFPVSPNFPVKCEQRQAVRSPGGRLSGPPPPRQPLADRGSHQVHVSSSLSTLATGSGASGLMPLFAEATAGAVATSVTGSLQWSGFAGRPAQAGDSAGRAPAAASPGAPGVALLPSYHNHMRASSAGIAGGTGSAAVHGAYGRTGPALLLPVVSGTDRPGVAAAAGSAHGLPPSRRHEAGCPPFGATLDFQPVSFSSRLLPLPNGAAILASNPPSSRSLMPRQPKVFGSDQLSAASRPPSLPANDVAIRPAAVRQLQPQQYVPSVSSLSSSASLVAHDQLMAHDHIGTIFRHLAQSGSANGSSEAVAGASWSAGRPNPLMHGHFNDWVQPVTTAGRVGQPARSRPAAAAASPSPGGGASLRNGEPAGAAAVPGAAFLKMSAASKGAAASTVVAAAASPLACAAGRPVSGHGVSAVGVAVGDHPGAAGSLSQALPDSKVQDRLPPPPPLLFVKRQATGPRQPLLLAPRDDSSSASGDVESANDRLSSLAGVSASSGSSTLSGVVSLNQARPTPRALASAASSLATSLADRAAACTSRPATGSATRLQTVADADLSDGIAVTSTLPSDIRRHVIEGFVIEESSQPFPVTRSSLLTSLVLKRKRGQAGRRNVRLLVAPQTDSSSRASSPLTASPATAATPDSVTAASGLLPCLLPPLSPAARTEAAAPAPHSAASAAAGAEARYSAAGVSSKPSRAELPEPSEWPQDATAAPVETRPVATSADPPPVCTFCGRNEVRVRAFSGKTFCSKSCAAAYRRSYNADGSPVAKRRRGRPPGSSSKLAEVTTKQKPAREKSRQRRFSGGSGEAVGVPSLGQLRSDLMAPQPGNGANSEPDSPASAGSGGVQATDECLSRSKILSWNVDDVYGFISAMDGCSLYADEFRSQEIDGQALLLLSEDHLVNALSIKLGPALKIISAIGPFQ